MGIALGFLLPPMLIKSHEILDDTVADLNTFFYCLGGITTAMSLITIIGKSPVDFDMSPLSDFLCSFQRETAASAHPSAFRSAGVAHQLSAIHQTAV